MPWKTLSEMPIEFLTHRLRTDLESPRNREAFTAATGIKLELPAKLTAIAPLVYQGLDGNHYTQRLYAEIEALIPRVIDGTDHAGRRFAEWAILDQNANADSDQRVAQAIMMTDGLKDACLRDADDEIDQLAIQRTALLKTFDPHEWDLYRECQGNEESRADLFACISAGAA